MRKKVVNDLIGTSTEILQTFWHKDMSLLSHYLDDDVFFVVLIQVNIILARMN